MNPSRRTKRMVLLSMVTLVAVGSPWSSARPLPKATLAVTDHPERERFPNSLTVVAPGQEHSYPGIDCRAPFISAFIERGTTGGLDTSCLAEVPLPPFP